MNRAKFVTIGCAGLAFMAFSSACGVFLGMPVWLIAFPYAAAAAIPALWWIVRWELCAIRWLWRRNSEMWREMTGGTEERREVIQ